MDLIICDTVVYYNDNLYLRNLFSDSDYSHPLSKIPISIEEAVNVLVAKDRNSLFMKYYAWHDNDEGSRKLSGVFF